MRKPHPLRLVSALLLALALAAPAAEAQIRREQLATPTVDGLMRKEDKKKVDQFVTLTSFAGVDPTNTTECAAAIQAALDFCHANEKTLLWDKGQYITASTLVVKCSVEADPMAQLRYSGSGTAMDIGEPGGSRTIPVTTPSSMWMKLPRIIKTGTQGVGKGLVLRDADSLNIFVPLVGGFADGVSLNGEGGGVSYNNIYLGDIRCYARSIIFDPQTHEAGANGTGNLTNGSNQVLNATGSYWVNQKIAGTGIPAGTTITAVSGTTLTLSANATATGTGVALFGYIGWSNQNNLYGGRLAFQSSSSSGTRQVQLGTATTSALPDNNAFYGVSFEGADTIEYLVECYGTNNKFDMCRWEIPLPGTPRVKFSQQSTTRAAWRNTIEGGYDVERIVVTSDSNTARNVVIADRTTTVYKGASAAAANDDLIFGSALQITGAGNGLTTAGGITSGGSVGVTGTVTASGTIETGANFTIDKAGTGSDLILNYQRDNLNKWAAFVTGAADTYSLSRYDAAGAFLDTPFSVNWTTGNISLAKPTTITGNSSVTGTFSVSSTLSAGAASVASVTNAGTYAGSGNLTLTADNVAANAGRSVLLRKRGDTSLSTNPIGLNGEHGYIDFHGWDGDSYDRGALILSNATEAWTTTAHGSKLTFFTTPNGSTTTGIALTLDQDKSATFAGNVSIAGTLNKLGDVPVLTALGAGAGTDGYAVKYVHANGRLELQPDATGAGGAGNTFLNITDGTTPAAADGTTDTFKLRAADANHLTITTANDDATHGDNALFTLNASATPGNNKIVQADGAGKIAAGWLTFGTAASTVAEGDHTHPEADLIWGDKIARQVFMGPDGGADAPPAFRLLVAADIPDLSATYATLTGPTIDSPTFTTVSNHDGHIDVASDAVIRWSSTGDPTGAKDTTLRRTSAGVLTVGDGAGPAYNDSDLQVRELFAQGISAEIIPIAELSDVAAKTGTGTTVVMSAAPDLTGTTTAEGIVASKRIVGGAFAVAYANPVAVNSDNGLTVNVGQLTGSPVISAPTGSPQDGQLLTYRLQQDATGGRVVDFDDTGDAGDFIFPSDIPETQVQSYTAASARFEVTFKYHAGITRWVCTGCVGAY